MLISSEQTPHFNRSQRSWNASPEELYGEVQIDGACIRILGSASNAFDFLIMFQSSS